MQRLLRAGVLAVRAGPAAGRRTLAKTAIDYPADAGPGVVQPGRAEADDRRRDPHPRREVTRRSRRPPGRDRHPLRKAARGRSEPGCRRVRLHLRRGGAGHVPPPGAAGVAPERRVEGRGEAGHRAAGDPGRPGPRPAPGVGQELVRRPAGRVPAARGQPHPARPVAALLRPGDEGRPRPAPPHRPARPRPPVAGRRLPGGRPGRPGHQRQRGGVVRRRPQPDAADRGPERRSSSRASRSPPTWPGRGGC